MASMQKHIKRPQSVKIIYLSEQHTTYHNTTLVWQVVIQFKNIS